MGDNALKGKPEKREKFFMTIVYICEFWLSISRPRHRYRELILIDTEDSANKHQSKEEIMTKSSKLVILVAAIIMAVMALVNVHMYEVMDRSTTAFNSTNNQLIRDIALDELSLADTWEHISAFGFMLALVMGIVMVACNERVARIRRERAALENRYR